MEKWKRPLTPEEDALEHIVACRDKPFLEERYIDSFKGRWSISVISRYINIEWISGITREEAGVVSLSQPIFCYLDINDSKGHYLLRLRGSWSELSGFQL